MDGHGTTHIDRTHQDYFEYLLKDWLHDEDELKFIHKGNPNPVKAVLEYRDQTMPDAEVYIKVKENGIFNA